jgi:hypothetical protein
MRPYIKVYGLRVWNKDSLSFALATEAMYRKMRESNPGLSRKTFHTLAFAIAEELVAQDNGDKLISASYLMARVKDRAHSAGM